MELLLHKGLGQFCEVADQWQLSGCICYTQLQSLLSFLNINPSWNKAAHLRFRPKGRVDHVLESNSWSHYYHYQCSPVPPPPLNNHKWNHLNNIAYLINFSRLHTMPDTQNCSQCACCEETQSSLSCCVADFPLILLHLICVLLQSHCNWMPQPRLVSLCSLLTASKKTFQTLCL